MSQTQTVTSNNADMITVIPHYVKYHTAQRNHLIIPGQQNISTVCSDLDNGQRQPYSSKSVFVGLGEYLAEIPFFLPITEQDVKDLQLSKRTLAEVIPPGHSWVHAILRCPEGDEEVVDETTVSSLRDEMRKMQQELEKRDMDNKAFRQQILDIMKADKEVAEAKFVKERELREAADARLQAQLDSEIVERQRQNCCVANAVVHQVIFSRFHFIFISDRRCQDPTLLSQIWFEDLLQRTQSCLAAHTNWPLINGSHLFAWRHALDTVGEDTAIRKNHARAALPNTPGLAALIASDEAMDILCMKKVNVRLGGDRVTAVTPTNVVDNLSALRTAAERLRDPVAKKGVCDIIQYDFSTQPV